MTEAKKHRSPREWRRILERSVGGEWSYDQEGDFYRTAQYNAPYEAQTAHEAAKANGKADIILGKLAAAEIKGAYASRNSDQNTEYVIVEAEQLKANAEKLIQTANQR